MNLNWDLISNFVIALLTYAILCAAVLAVLAVLFFTLITGPAIQKVTGQLPLNLISRIFGMILIAIAVQFMVGGLSEAFPGLSARGEQGVVRAFAGGFQGPGSDGLCGSLPKSIPAAR